MSPKIHQVFQEVVEAQAKPYLEHALRAYRACTLNGRRSGFQLEDWSQFCEHRGSRLPRSMQPGESETSVEVVRE